MIDFNTFVTKANQLAQANQAETDSIVLDTQNAGQLGTHKVTVEKPTKEQTELIQRTKNELTQSLCSKFGVEARKSIPTEVLEILDVVDKSKTILSKDIIKLNERVTQVTAARDKINAAFARVVDTANTRISNTLVMIGCPQGLTLPKGCPLQEALNDAEKSLRDLVFSFNTKVLTGGHGKNFPLLLTKSIATLLDKAFGDHCNGPLALKLKDIIAQNPGLDNDALTQKFNEAFNEFHLPGLTSVPNKTGLNATGPTALSQERDRLMADFAKTIEKFAGPGNADIVLDKSSPIGKALAEKADELMSDGKKFETTVGDLRKALTTIFEEQLGTEKFPTDLAREMKQDIADNADLRASEKRISLAYGMAQVLHKDKPDVELLATRAAIKRAILDTDRNFALNADGIEKGVAADKLPEPFYQNPEIRHFLDYLLQNDCKTEESAKAVADLIRNGDAQGVINLARDKGCIHLTDAEVEDHLQGLTEEEISSAVRNSDRAELKQPGVQLYIQQRLGKVPVDYHDSSAVYQKGNWLENREVGLAILSSVITLMSDESEPSVPQTEYAPRFEITLKDLRETLNPKAEGGFKTDPLKTKGQISVDSKGKIHSHNRHFGSSVPMTEADNLTLKLCILDRLSQETKNAEILTGARTLLGIGTLKQGEPINRSTLKTIFTLLDDEMALAEAKLKPEIAKKPETPKPATVKPATVKTATKKTETAKTSKVETQKAFHGGLATYKEIAEVMGVKNIKLVDTSHDGNCFFDAVSKQLTQDEKSVFEGNGDAKSIRSNMVKEAKDLLNGLDLPQTSPYKPKGIQKTEEGEIFVYPQSNRLDGVIVTNGCNVLNKDGFAGSTEYAEITHGAFIANMYKRPVVIVTQMLKQDGTYSEPQLQKFDTDLFSDEPFPADAKPIYMYFTREDEIRGHFQVIQVEN